MKAQVNSKIFYYITFFDLENKHLMLLKSFFFKFFFCYYNILLFNGKLYKYRFYKIELVKGFFKRNFITLLKSPHVNKKARIQLETINKQHTFKLTIFFNKIKYKKFFKYLTIFTENFFIIDLLIKPVKINRFKTIILKIKFFNL